MTEDFVSGTEFFAFVKMTESPYERRRVDHVSVCILQNEIIVSPCQAPLQEAIVDKHSAVKNITSIQEIRVT